MTPSKFSVTLTSQLKSPIEREETKNDPKRTEQQKRTESTINPIKREATRYREPLIAFGFRPLLAGVSFPGNTDDTYYHKRVTDLMIPETLVRAPPVFRSTSWYQSPHQLLFQYQANNL